MDSSFEEYLPQEIELSQDQLRLSFVSFYLDRKFSPFPAQVTGAQPGPSQPAETCGDLWPSFGEICCFFSRFECPHHHIAIQPIRGLGLLQSTNERRQNLRQPLHHHNPRVIYDAGSSGTLNTGARGHNFISHVLLLHIIPQHDVVNKTTNYHQTPEL